jgi:hypothetical protein
MSLISDVFNQITLFSSHKRYFLSKAQSLIEKKPSGAEASEENSFYYENPANL